MRGLAGGFGKVLVLGSSDLGSIWYGFGWWLWFRWFLRLGLGILFGNC